MIDQLNMSLLKLQAAVLGRLASGVETRDRIRREDGQAFVEYVLVLTLVGVAVALLAQWTSFTQTIANSLGRVMNALTGAGTSTG
ncbi:MAG TPA: hypothetical protein VFA19_03710 [Gaiellaceae bacterium]|nr:hypothetical protein [Gaiellaceae bacterium]